MKKINLPAVLIGSKKDIICNEIEFGYKKAVNLAGQTDIRLAVSIISNANKVIGSDTGLIHAAEALGKNVVMIMGPTSKETGGGTIRKKSIVIEKDIFCRPCSQNGKFPCYRSNQECMESISSRRCIISNYFKGLILNNYFWFIIYNVILVFPFIFLMALFASIFSSKIREGLKGRLSTKKS